MQTARMSSAVRPQLEQPQAPSESLGPVTSLLRPLDSEDIGLDFDQFQRYSFAAQILDRMLQGIQAPIRILEVGSNVLNLLPCFLDPLRVEVVRCDTEPTAVDDPNFTLLDPEQPLPFAADSFDAIIALEVLEHVPAERRERFLRECITIGRRGAVFSCPNGSPEVHEAEGIAAAAYLTEHGRPHPFLAEHQTFGLPTEASLRDLLTELDVPFAVFDNAPVDMWLALHLLGDRLGDDESSLNVLSRLNQAALRGQFGGCGIPYRKFYVCAKQFEATAALEAPAGSRFTPTGTGSKQPAQPLALAALRELAIAATDALRGLEREYRAEVVAHRWHRTTAAQQLLLVNSFLMSLLGSWTWKLGAPLRLLREWLKPRGFTAIDLRPSHDLEPMADAPAGSWLATGVDPQFLVACYLPAGWVHIQLRMSSETTSRFEFFVDRGYGFRLEDCVERGEVRGRITEDFFLYLDQPGRGVRFDPIDSEGTFRLESLAVTPVPPPAALWHALRGKVDKLCSAGLVVRCLSRGFGLLVRGRIGTFAEKLYRGLDGPKYLWTGYQDLNADYEAWRCERQPTDAERALAQDDANAIQASEQPPLLSIILPVYNVPEPFLRLAIDSVLAQSYGSWQLCIADDGSTAPHIRRVLDGYAERDARIEVVYRPVNGGISAASNDALDLAKGDFVALLDHDDELAEDALLRIAQHIVADRGADLLYSDMDMLELDGRHVEPFFKPDWSPEYLLGCMYLAHLGVYRTSLLRELGGFRSEFDLAQDYDLALRFSARTSRVVHIPEVLYHWRKLPTSTASSNSAKPQAHKVARRALQDHLNAIGRPARVEATAIEQSFHRVRFAIQGRPLVSIIIPTASRSARIRGREVPLVVNCVESIRRKSTYLNYEILVIDNDDMPTDLERSLRPFGATRIRYTDSFNLSSKMNLGAAKASGDHLLFLNDDTEVISRDWLECLLEYSQQPDIGAVGAKLLFPDGRIQHVGVTIVDGKPLHHFYGYPANFQGHFGGNLVVRNYSAVTGACLMTRPDVFHDAGGFDEAFPLNFNDVDWCLKVRALGKRIVFTPFAELYHYEAVSKTGCFPEELERFQQRWHERFPRDPYFNPNLSTNHHDYRLAVDAVA